MNQKTRGARRTGYVRWLSGLLLAALLLTSFMGCSWLEEKVQDYLATESETVTEFTGETDDGIGSAQFYFFDVGQGDSALIRTPEGVVLIDASINAYEDELKGYLNGLGVTTIDYAVFTHPDADHIGGADMIMETFDVKHVIMSGHVSSTKTYERLLDAIEASDAEVTVPEPGQIFTLGDLTMEILAPIKDYKDSNENSVVFRATFGETTVLFTGDAEKESEGDMVKAYGQNGKLDCDLLKAGHHGSRSSSTQAFMEAVSPTYVVISCGEGNSYGHPHKETMTRYETMGLHISRTDTEGTVVFISDGKTLTKQ